MKKAKSAPKKMNNIKSKAKSPTKVLGQMKKLAKGLVKAMAPKSAKKPQTKVAPKAAKPAPKAAKPAPKVDLKASKKAKAAPVVKAAAPAKVAPKKEIKKELPKAAVAAPVKGKAVPAPVAAPAILTKGKAPKVAKLSKAAALLAYNEKMCRETGCENQSTTKGYCRLDYIKNWKKIKRKEMILKEGKLNQYIEELVSKYPDKYIDVIRQDLTSEVNFNKVIHDLELDESIDDLDYDGDSIDSLIGSIRKEDDDFGDSEF
jgi:hypothetical protein